MAGCRCSGRRLGTIGHAGHFLRSARHILPEGPIAFAPFPGATVAGVNDVNSTPFGVGGVGAVGVDEDGSVDEDGAHQAPPGELAPESQELTGSLVLGVVVVDLAQGRDIRALDRAVNRPSTQDVLPFRGSRTGLEVWAAAEERRSWDSSGLRILSVKCLPSARAAPTARLFGRDLGGLRHDSDSSA